MVKQQLCFPPTNYGGRQATTARKFKKQNKTK
jgi:hypothetical protein